MTTSPDQLLQTDSVLAAQAPHVRDHFGLWGIQPEYLQAAVDRLNGCNFSDHLKIQSAAVGRSRFGQQSYSTVDGVAIIELRGPLTKRPTSFSSGTSTIEARQQLRHAARDESVEKILLVIESPGGAAAGTAELADEVAAANKVKPVVAYVEDLCASCAYWVASQAGRIYANRTALVGAIGTYVVLRDVSEVASRIGLRVHVVKAGQHKGLGVPGAAITPEQLAMIQNVVNAITEQFLLAVATGRKIPIEKLREFADGRVHVGQEAVQVGLIDGIQSLDETLASLHSQGAPSRNRGMSASQSADSVQAFVGAVARQRDGGLSEEDAITAVAKADQGLFGRYLSATFPTLNAGEKLQAIEQARLPAVSPVSSKISKGSVMTPQQQSSQPAAPQGQTDPIAEFNSRVAAQVAGGMSRRDAIKAVVKDDRGLHARYLSATNPQTKAAVRLDIIAAGDEADTATKAKAGAEAVAAFEQLVSAKQASTGMRRGRAAVNIAKANPALHKAYLIATNPRNRSGAAECADQLHS